MSIRYLIAQVDAGLSGWLVDQVPVIVVMGVVIWWLARRLEKIEQQKNVLAESMIKLTTLYESKLDMHDANAKDTKVLLEEIISLIKHGKGA